MEQSDIIYVITNKFADKFKSLSRVKIKDSYDNEKQGTEPVIFLTLVGIEEMFDQNMNRKIQKTGTDAQGKEYEFFIKPASHFTLTYMVTPYFKTYADSLKIVGAIVKIIKDDGVLSPGEHDWVENNNNPIYITPLTGMNFEKQMQLCNMLRTEYWPSLFYQILVGIDSSKEDVFTRVKERKISTVKHTDKPPRKKEKSRTAF